ncbi:PD40 domain-containing protein [soil metagenome]
MPGPTSSPKLKILIALTALVALAFAASAVVAKPAKTKTTRLSVKAKGKEVKAASADFPALSADGRYVAFEAFGQLVSKDKDMSLDVYLYDRTKKKNTLISVKSNGSAGQNIGCGVADIAPHARYVSFACDGALVSDGTNDLEDVYRHDLKTGKTIRVSLNGSDNQLTGINDASEISGVADDSRVAWESYGAFVGNDTNTAYDIFVRDSKKGTTLRATQDYQNQQLPNGTSALSPTKQSKIAISGNGKFVAFPSSDPATADPDYGMAVDSDVFVRNIDKKVTTRVSVKTNGDEASSSQNAPSNTPSISANGRYVAFQADPATAFTGKDTNNDYDIYVRDRKKGKTSLASVKSNGKQATPSGLAPQYPEISPNGRYVAFDTGANYGGGNDPGGFRDVYRRDLTKKKTKLVSLKTNGGRADTNQLADPSNNGWVTFSSMGKLTSGDDGNDFDVFLRGPLK